MTTKITNNEPVKTRFMYHDRYYEVSDKENSRAQAFPSLISKETLYVKLITGELYTFDEKTKKIHLLTYREAYRWCLVNKEDDSDLIRACAKTQYRIQLPISKIEEIEQGCTRKGIPLNKLIRQTVREASISLLREEDINPNEPKKKKAIQLEEDTAYEVVEYALKKQKGVSDVLKSILMGDIAPSILANMPDKEERLTNEKQQRERRYVHFNLIIPSNEYKKLLALANKNQQSIQKTTETILRTISQEELEELSAKKRKENLPDRHVVRLRIEKKEYDNTIKPVVEKKNGSRTTLIKNALCFALERIGQIDE